MLKTPINYDKYMYYTNMYVHCRIKTILVWVAKFQEHRHFYIFLRPNKTHLHMHKQFLNLLYKLVATMILYKNPRINTFKVKT